MDDIKLEVAPKIAVYTPDVDAKGNKVQPWDDAVTMVLTYAEIPYDQMTPEQQDAYRSLIETRGRLPGPNKIYVHNPKLAKVMGPLGAHFRTGYSLSEREREIAVNVILAKWGSAYPTNAHERAGKAAGLPADKVEAILAGLPTSFTDTREQIIYEMVSTITHIDVASATSFDGRC